VLALDDRPDPGVRHLHAEVDGLVHVHGPAVADDRTAFDELERSREIIGLQD
jgi:hypothetical protein